MEVFEFSEKIRSAAEAAMHKCKGQFAELDRLCEYNGQRVLKAFIDNRVSEIHLKGTTGYSADRRSSP